MLYSNAKINNHISEPVQDRIFHVINIAIMLVLLFVFIWPLWFVVIASFSDPAQVQLGNVLFWPVNFSTASYGEMFKRTEIWTSYLNTIYYTVVGTAVNLFITVCAAYPLSRKDFMLKQPLMIFFLITMYFSGGLIPLYILVTGLGLVNTRACLIIAGALSVYNMLIVRSFFMNSIPASLQEAAMLDGANSAQYLVKIALPLSKPVLAVITLYYAIGHWNDYYTALVYIQDRDLYPLQLVLKEILTSVKAQSTDTSNVLDAVEKVRIAQALKYSTIIAATVPMLIIYPFIQKYFVKGVMIGAVKG